MRNLRTAVIGCGDISPLHIDAIAQLPGAELVAVCDTDPGRRAQAAQDAGVPGTATLTETLERFSPDVVHLCTPHDQHADLAIEALAAGVEVLTEKPLASTLEDARRIVDAAAAPGAPRIGVCFQNRYNATVQEAHRVLTTGELGAPTGAAATVAWHRTPDYYRARPWRGTWAGSGGGLLINQAIHTLDLLQWLLGGVSAVTGCASTDVLGGTIEVEDTATATLTHPSGTHSVLLATNGAPTNLPVQIDIVCERGTLQIAQELTVLPADGEPRVVSERAAPAGARSYWGASHTALISDFYAGHGNGEPFWISPAEALPALQALKAVYDSPRGFPDRPGAELDRDNPLRDV